MLVRGEYWTATSDAPRRARASQCEVVAIDGLRLRVRPAAAQSRWNGRCLMPGSIVLILVLLALAASGLKVVREYERLVVFRLGRLVGPRGPGVIVHHPGHREGASASTCAPSPWTSRRRT